MTPGDCDLRDFSRMMIDIGRLFGSGFNSAASRNPVAWMIGHKLWYRSWHQVPAASLPDDDEELCHLAELGFDMRTFSKARAIAMRGWVKCSDGRLYHPTVAEIALESWLEKLMQRISSGKGNAQRWGTEFDPEPVTAAIDEALRLLATLNPASKTHAKIARRRSQQGSGSARVVIPSGSKKHPAGNAGGTPNVVPIQSQETGTGTGTGTQIKKKNTPQAASLPEDHLWSAGKAFLVSRGVAEGRVGGIIGKWKRDYGVSATIEALGVAQVEPNLVDPLPFITAVLKRRNTDDPDDPRVMDGMRFSSPC